MSDVDDMIEDDYDPNELVFEILLNYVPFFLFRILIFCL